MTRKNLAEHLHDLAGELRRAAGKVAADGRGGRIDVSRRRNVQTAINVGSPGSSQEATAVQDAPIRQDGATDGA